jgi:hypothetical protein
MVSEWSFALLRLQVLINTQLQLGVCSGGDDGKFLTVSLIAVTRFGQILH